MIRVPWKAASVGKHTTSFVELLDLYRTLVSLTGLPSAAIQKDVDGTDLSPLFDAPTKPLKAAAYSQYSRCPGGRDFMTDGGQPGPIGSKSKEGWPWPPSQRDASGAVEGYYMNNCEPVPAANISFMGYTVRTAEFRYTEWLHWDGEHCVAIWPPATAAVAEPELRELYSHEGQPSFPVDFDNYENVNLASEAKYASPVQRHRALLEARFKQKMPVGCPPDIGPDGKALQPTELETL